MSFIRDCRNLRGLEVYSWNVVDLTPVEELEQLEFLSIQVDLKKGFDLAHFPTLKTLRLFWKPSVVNLERCTYLDELNVVDYPGNDLRLIGGLLRLRTLKLTSKNIEALDGLDRLSSLRVLDLFECRNLGNLTGLEKAETLEELSLSNCVNVFLFPSLSSLSRLGSVAFHECGDVASLNFLVGCTALKTLHFEGSNILDGDLSPVLELSNLEDLIFEGTRIITLISVVAICSGS